MKRISRFILCLWFGFAIDAMQAAEPARVAAADVEAGKVRLVGALGTEFGTVVEVEAVIAPPQVPGEKFPGLVIPYRLKVTQVGGRELPSPVVVSFVVESNADVRIASDSEQLETLLTALGTPNSRLVTDPKTGALTGSDALSQSELAAIRKNYLGSKHRLLVYETGAFVGRPGKLPADMDNSYVQLGRGFRFETFVMVLHERKLNP